MTRCPYCDARGVKLADEVAVQGVAFRVDYCGNCGRNWPKALSERVEADGVPPQDDSGSVSDAPRRDHNQPLRFAAKVAEMAERWKPSGVDFKHSQAGER